MGLRKTILDNVEVHIYPFPHCVATEALDWDDYYNLYDARPDWKFIAGNKADESNIRIDIPAIEALESTHISHIWKDFIKAHTSQEYWERWTSIFGPMVIFCYPWIEWAVGKPIEKWKTAVRYSKEEADVYLDCQIGINTPVKHESSVIGPHLDNPEELYGSILYMRDPADTSEGGDLEAYELMEKPLIYGKREIELGQDDEVFTTVDYAPNNYFGFINTPYSAHGVTPRTATTRPRQIVNINIELCSKHKRLFNPEVYRR